MMREAVEHLQKEVSRRAFMKRTVQAAGIGLFWGSFGDRLFGQSPASATNPTAVFGGIGNIVIPVDQDPGWATFEPGISDYGLNKFVKQVLLAGDELSFQGLLGTMIAFNELPPLIGFAPLQFLQMPVPLQAQYFGAILTGQLESTGAQDVLFLATFVGLFGTKAVFFSNYPNHLATPDAEFQVRPPSDVKTGWDIMGFRGPVGPEEERRLRAQRGHIQVVRGMDPNNIYV